MTTEQKTVDENTKVTDMEVGDLVGLLLFALDQRHEARKKAGDPLLNELSVKEFTETVLALTRTGQYAQAQSEADTARQVIMDWQGLKAVEAVTQPFRVKNADGIAELCESLERGLPSLRDGAELVVAVAIVKGGAYAKVAGR